MFSVCFFLLSLGAQNIACNVTKCAKDEVIQLLYETETSGDLMELQSLGQITTMCNNLFDSDSSIKSQYFG